MSQVLLRAYPIAIILAIWEISGRLGMVDPFLVPAFSDVMKAMIANADLLVKDSGITLIRAAVGLAVGGSIGLIVGMTMARYRPVNDFFDPLISAIFPTPKLALFPLMMVWFGLGETSKIALVASSAFFPICVNTYAGIRGVDRFLIWNAQTKGADQFQMLFKVMLPAALPFIFTGLRVSTAFSFLLAIAAEMLAANNGLGYRLVYAQRTFEPQTMYASLLLVAALGFLVDRLLGILIRRLLVWQDTTEVA
jgi:ABC-type nitrate/sulfonate/bicarbonate transport system permease component